MSCSHLGDLTSGHQWVWVVYFFLFNWVMLGCCSVLIDDQVPIRGLGVNCWDCCSCLSQQILLNLTYSFSSFKCICWALLTQVCGWLALFLGFPLHVFALAAPHACSALELASPSRLCLLSLSGLWLPGSPLLPSPCALLGINWIEASHRWCMSNLERWSNTLPTCVWVFLEGFGFLRI